jgi:NADH dehydrogenase FAD-containing subunit
MNSKHLVFVGGGHAHLTCLKNLDRFTSRGHRVSVISPSAYHYYSGMAPGMLSGIYRPQEVRFHIRRMAEERGGRFIDDWVMRIDPVKKTLFLSSGKEVTYDVLSCNVGSEVPVQSLMNSKEKHVFTVKPVINFLRIRDLVVTSPREKELRCVVFGGGPAGLEVAGNLWRLVSQNGYKARITLVAGKKLLGGFPERARLLALRSFSARDVEVIEGNHVDRIAQGRAFLRGGTMLTFDLALIGLGIMPSPIFKESGLPTGDDGGLLVNRYLQSTTWPTIFGGGDCISFQDHPLSKVGVYAVKQNPVLYHNLIAALEGGKMEPFTPQREYMLIFNMGDGRGILWKKDRVWQGKFAFILKNYIDRRFMRKFQVSGELDEAGPGFEPVTCE